MVSDTVAQWAASDVSKRAHLAWLLVIAMGCNLGCDSPTTTHQPQGPIATNIPTEKPQKPRPTIDDNQPFSAWTPSTALDGRAPDRAHSAAISQVHVDPSSTVVLTIDGHNQSRLWESLDGSQEPLVAPFGFTQDASLAVTPTGIVVAVIDAVGRLQIAKTISPGEIILSHQGNPSQQVRDVLVMPKTGWVVVLRNTFAIEVRDSDGNMITQFDERDFQPRSLHLSGPDTFIALTQIRSEKAVDFQFDSMRIAASADETTLVRTAAPFSVHIDNVASNAKVALSPNGKLLAMPIIEGDETHIRLFAAAANTQVPTQTAGPWKIDRQTDVQFASNTSLFLKPTKDAMWTINIMTGKRQSIGVRYPGMIKNGKYIGTIRSWLHIRDLASNRGLYLGYRIAQPTAVAISPSGNLLISSRGNELFVHDRQTAADWKHRFLANRTPHTIAFLDEQHILVITMAGNAIVMELSSTKVIAAIDGPQQVTFTHYDPRQHVVILGNSKRMWVAGVDRHGFSSVAIINDQSNRAGFIDDGEFRIWTAQYSILRTYNAAELRNGLQKKSASGRGVGLTEEPLGLTRAGKILVNYRSQLAAFAPPPLTKTGIESTGDKVYPSQRKFDLTTPLITTGQVSSPRSVHPSPSGTQLAVMTDQSLFVLDTDTLQSSWEMRWPNSDTKISWAQTGNYLAMTSGVSMAMVSAKNGQVIHLSCSSSFVATNIEPIEVVSLSQTNSQTNLCQR